MPEPARAVCPGCRKQVAVVDGCYGPHTIRWSISARAVRTVGHGTKSLRCPKAGQPIERSTHDGPP